MGVSNMTLVKIAAIGGMVTVSMGLLTRHKINGNIKATDYYREAMTTVRQSRGAVYYLGEPIKEGSIDIDDKEKNFTRESEARYEVPVRGRKETGTVYFSAKKVDDKWVVDSVLLGLDKEPNKRLIVKQVEVDK